MTCEHEDRLLDLVYGELDESEAAQLRSAIDACGAECAEHLLELEDAKRLADELPLEPMPQVAHRSIMEAARAHAAGASNLATAATVELQAPALEAKDRATARDETPKVGLFAGLLEWLKGSIHGPQIAMAMGAAVAIVVVVLLLPKSSQEDSLALRDVAPDPEAVTPRPSPSVDPQLQHELEAPLEPAAEAEASAVLEEPEELALEGVTGRRNRAAPRRRSAATMSSAAASRTTMFSYDQDGLTDNFSGNSAVREQNALVEAERDRARPDEVTNAAVPLPASVPSIPEAEEQQAPSVGIRPQTRSGHPSPPPASANTVEPIQGDRATYRRGIQHYEARQYRAAEQELERVVQRPQDDVRRLVPSALHYLARSHRQRGACSTALRHYTQLFARHPSYRQIPHAQVEAADCYRRQGRYSDARRLLEQAAQHQATAAAARRELQRIETLERGQRRMRRRAAPSPQQFQESFDNSY